MCNICFRCKGGSQGANCIRIGQLFNLYIFHSNLILKSPSSDTASGRENFASCSLQPKMSTLYPL